MTRTVRFVASIAVLVALGWRRLTTPPGPWLLVMLLLMLGPHQGRPLRAQTESRLFVQVFAADGSAVTDLTAEDFVIESGNVEGRVIRAELVEEPLRLALLVDDADGADPYFRFLRNGLPVFVDALPSTSEVSLVLLSGRPRVVVDHTEGLAEVRDHLNGLFTWQGTSAGFFDGLTETLAGFDPQLNWPVMAVVTTDGASRRDIFSEGKYSDFRERLASSGATVHALGLSTPTGDGFQTRLVEDVARLSGGSYLTLNSPSQAVTDQLTVIAAEISRRYAASLNQYLVVYELPPGSDPDVLASAGVRRPDVTLHLSADGRPRPGGLTGAARRALAIQELNDAISARQAQVTALQAEIEELQREASALVGTTQPPANASGSAGRAEPWNAAEAAFANGQMEEAITLYRQAHEADPTWGKPLFKLALVALNQGDVETAVTYFEEVVAVDPNSGEAAQATEFVEQLKP
ncbi:MAG: hypothetical protein CL483_13120 [Acidobacteria bacterium]|nr:hypothetical protein [Acidobacteriota bacterium]|tara:strand:+ start:552 stop:1943 length:1392 start_codon:yes stop_codon:yes gene_type:complete